MDNPSITDKMFNELTLVFLVLSNEKKECTAFDVKELSEYQKLVFYCLNNVGVS